MSGLEDLPPDQRAALTLLVCQQRRYAEVAASLHIGADAVHDRAHAALAALAPELGEPLPRESRERIGELLLGQLEDEDSIIAAKLQIAASEQESRWARALATQLQLLPGASIPALWEQDAPQPSAPREERADRPQASPPPRDQRRAPRRRAPRAERAERGQASPPPQQRPTPQPHPPGGRDQQLTVSRRGGAALLLALAAAAAVAILLTTGGGSHGKAGLGRATTAAQESSTASERSASTTQTPQLEKQINLTPPSGSGSASGIAILASEESKHAIVLSAEKLLPTSGFVYYLWLVDSTGKAQPHPYEAPSVSASGTQKGKMSAISLLPKNASAYDRIELTKEHPRTTANGKHTPPSSPSGEVVLSAPFSA